jgi:RNA polymerase sigma-70 factor (ECF subfamily)
MRGHPPDREAGRAAAPETDEQLLRAAGKGSAEAFGDLVERHADSLFRLAYRLVGNASDAEDVLQEAVMGAFEQAGRFRGHSTVKTWLTRIVMRQAARSHRRRARRATGSLPEGMAHDGSGGPEATALRMDVTQALRKLTPDHREVVVLREFEGLSYAEMAETLGLPQGTVESRLHRARQELKELLRDYLP